ncbi:uncharacterized protein LOC112183885 [Rosa chinensis]|uniref:uncharacterized protein LOC112183885 n=1 Tax=Rosa chinensis TaxID=74649 RepID=UPI000D0909E5|nr:uncharacterized protein LOC112183885 [Rosa chinensis]
MANRPKKWLPDIISPLQSAYVPGRLISDNTLVATEVAHFMCKLRHREEGFFSLKLDISKAYDRLEWKFLQAILTKLGFDSKWINMVMSCVMSVTYAILVNASIQECTRVREILNTYECASGKKINFQKSSVVFSRNVPKELQYEFAVVLEVNCVEEHDRYLGLPLRVGKAKMANFRYIKEKLTKKLVNWKFKILSCARKEILIKAFPQTMPLYAMNCYLLPKGLCDDIHQLYASFFWGDTDDKRRIHWSSSERLCLTKHEGDMGFKNIFAYNLAMLAKQGWRLVSKPNSLVARVFKARYFPNCSFWEAQLGDTPSYSWRSILEGRPVLKAGVKWRVGDGEQIHIWEDKWIPNYSRSQIHRPENSTSFDRVADLIDPHTRSWIAPSVSTLFSPEVAAQILSIPLRRRAVSDKLLWEPKKRGYFTVKTAYWIAREQVLRNALASTSQGDPFKELWKLLWKARVPAKITTLWEDRSRPPLVLLCKALAWLEDFQKAHATLTAPKQTVKHYWRPTHESRVKINVDGAFLPSQVHGGAGGIARDLTGQFMATFAHHIPYVNSAKQAELLAIRTGLEMAIQLQLSYVSIETDCLVAVQEIMHQQSDYSEFAAIIANIQEL